jgi:hypothetical protein
MNLPENQSTIYLSKEKSQQFVNILYNINYADAAYSGYSVVLNNPPENREIYIADIFDYNDILVCSILDKSPRYFATDQSYDFEINFYFNIHDDETLNIEKRYPFLHEKMIEQFPVYITVKYSTLQQQVDAVSVANWSFSPLQKFENKEEKIQPTIKIGKLKKWLNNLCWMP